MEKSQLHKFKKLQNKSDFAQQDFKNYTLQYKVLVFTLHITKKHEHEQLCNKLLKIILWELKTVGIKMKYSRTLPKEWPVLINKLLDA